MTTQTDQSSLANDRDPFAVLGLPADPDLTNDQVEQAWQQRVRAERDSGNIEARTTVTNAYEALRSAARRADILTGRDPEPLETAPRAISTDDTLTELVVERLTNGRRYKERTVRGGPDDIQRAQAEKGVGAERVATPRSELSSRPSAERLEEVRRRVIAERKRQGLPETIEDPAILDKIVDILTLALDYGEQRYQRAGTARGAGPGTIPWERADAEERQGAADRDSQPGRLSVLRRRIQQGRPLWLAARLLLAVAVPTAAYLLQPDYPSWIALAVGSLTWIGSTMRYDLGPTGQR